MQHETVGGSLVWCHFFLKTVNTTVNTKIKPNVAGIYKSFMKVQMLFVYWFIYIHTEQVIDFAFI